MDFKECIKFANENPTCFLATIDKDQPRVRGMQLYRADETGFYFSTGTPKDIYRQLSENSNAEICFYSPKENKTIRIQGKVEFLNDMKLKNEILEARPYLKPFIKIPGNPLFCVFRISHGEAYTWTFETNMKLKEMINF